MADEVNKVDLVCEGGGVRGIALVGAVSVLEEHGYEFQNLAGTSAGAIVATLLAAGYKAAELKKILEELDFNQFTDKGWEDRVPLAGVPLSVLKDQGIYEGDAFLEWMRARLTEKKVFTFSDLIYDDLPESDRYRYKVQVIASDVTNRRLLTLPNDANLFGSSPDDLEVAMAVRMSMSIPIFFEPVRLENPVDDKEHLIVDGGMLSNFPVWLFDSDGPPEWPTFGLKLVAGDPKKPIRPEPVGHFGIRALGGFLSALVSTMTDAHDRMYLEKDTFVRTITIDTLDIGSTDFDLTRAEAEALYQSGRKAAEQFLSTWSFKGYVSEFRSGKTHSRREEVAKTLSKPKPKQSG